MPWTTPTLKQVRQMVRDDVASALGGTMLLANSVLRVIADANAGLGHLTLRYLDWLARQLLPDTADTQWLDRHGTIWLTNSDGSKGRKAAGYAKGVVTMTGTYGTVVPQGTVLSGANGINYQTSSQIIIGSDPTPVDTTCLTAGLVGNLDPGDVIAFETAQVGVDSQVAITTMEGGTDVETDDDLRARVLFRIQQPPMGGDASDYIIWTNRVPGVTRAWCYPLEMGIGTVTVRFMMDDLRAVNSGFPSEDDVQTVADYLDTVRPVAIKDFFVEAPQPCYLDLKIANLESDDADTRAAITQSIEAMLFEKAEPGQTIYRSWMDAAIAAAQGVDHYDLTFNDTPMPSGAYLAMLGTIVYA